MSFSNQYCIAIESALERKFPGIHADCEMDSMGEGEVIFEEGKYSREEVERYLANLKNEFAPNKTQ